MPCDGAGKKRGARKTSRMWACSPRRCRPAQAITRASASPSSSLRTRVSTLPRMGTTTRSGRAEALAERALLHDLHGGCNAPVGALARANENALALVARVLSPDGREVLEDRIHGPLDDAIYLGQELARRLIARGAKRLIDAARAC